MLLKDYIFRSVSNSDFLSIDLEMSGTISEPVSSFSNSKYESNFERYLKVYTSIIQYIPLQMGLCCVNLKQNSFETFNFYLNFLKIRY